MKPEIRTWMMITVLLVGVAVWKTYLTPSNTGLKTSDGRASSRPFMDGLGHDEAWPSVEKKPPAYPAISAQTRAVTKAKNTEMALSNLDLLDEHLTTEECLALCDYLIEPHRTEDRPSRELTYVLKNNIMALLCRQKTTPPGWTECLMTIAQNPQEDPVIQDYALQFLADHFHNVTEPGERQDIETLFWQTAENRQSPLAGTALLGLNRMQLPETGQLKRLALTAAASPESSRQTRITAMRLCGNMNIRQAEAVALELLRNRPSIPLTCAALATYAELAGQKAVPLLTAWSSDPNPTYSACARAALKKLTYQEKS